MDVFFIISGVLFGSITGSFFTAVLYREHHNQSWVFDKDRRGAARSRCPHCGHILRWQDLLPILSWVLQNGKCRYCGAGIGYSYILIEIAFAMLGAVYFSILPVIYALLNLLLSCGVLALIYLRIKGYGSKTLIVFNGILFVIILSVWSVSHFVNEALRFIG